MTQESAKAIWSCVCVRGQVLKGSSALLLLRMKNVHCEHLSVLVSYISSCSICENLGKFLYFTR